MDVLVPQSEIGIRSSERKRAAALVLTFPNPDAAPLMDKRSDMRTPTCTAPAKASTAFIHAVRGVSGIQRQAELSPEGRGMLLYIYIQYTNMCTHIFSMLEL